MSLFIHSYLKNWGFLFFFSLVFKTWGRNKKRKYFEKKFCSSSGSGWCQNTNRTAHARVCSCELLIVNQQHRCASRTPLTDEWAVGKEKNVAKRKEKEEFFLLPTFQSVNGNTCSLISNKWTLSKISCYLTFGERDCSNMCYQFFFLINDNNALEWNHLTWSAWRWRLVGAVI